ncbi:50S ribosomal protein L31 [Candidatus Roizmanbacteria bacterium RIFCSPLOWO2_02_FULL_38_10]|uniref:50S ribosomal protein L31 n=1 Tax=Candidatus Roizmanbacteria bacterium RIFCSPLOWO2_02_FULL_38_10 TaxID=1802074 RepID=A0A1F7JJS7_9BACT|nr:MAG: 50S ribosomal protein L31 [Candidatus Roizmanbacteria bacterium RIFCSPLOWO2_02_FULL_38_10]
MKKNIHPIYHQDAKVTCSCGHTFTTGSTKAELRVEVCSHCHPLYTGEKRFVDTLGQVGKYQKKQQIAKELEAVRPKKRQKQVEKQDHQPKTLRELLGQM